MLSSCWVGRRFHHILVKWSHGSQIQLWRSIFLATQLKPHLYLHILKVWLKYLRKFSRHLIGLGSHDVGPTQSLHGAPCLHYSINGVHSPQSGFNIYDLRLQQSGFVRFLRSGGDPCSAVAFFHHALQTWWLDCHPHLLRNIADWPWVLWWRRSLTYHGQGSVNRPAGGSIVQLLSTLRLGLGLGRRETTLNWWLWHGVFLSENWRIRFPRVHRIRQRTNIEAINHLGYLCFLACRCSLLTRHGLHCSFGGFPDECSLRRIK